MWLILPMINDDCYSIHIQYSDMHWSVMTGLDPPKTGPPGPDFSKNMDPPGTNFTEVHGPPEHIWTPQGVHILLKYLFPLKNTLISES